MVPDYRLDTTLVKNIIHAFRPAVAFGYLERHVTVCLYSENINLDWVLISYSTLEPSSRIGIRRVPTTLDQGCGRSWGAKGRCPAFSVVGLGSHPVWQILKNHRGLGSSLFRLQPHFSDYTLWLSCSRKGAPGVFGELVERLLLECRRSWQSAARVRLG
jgi:hypothetical protein